MADAKLNVAIAGQCLTFAGWGFIHCGVYQNGLKHVQIWGQVDSPSIRIQECDENADELGDLYYAQTIGEFRNVVKLILGEGFTIVEASELLLSDGWNTPYNAAGNYVYLRGSNYVRVGYDGAFVKLQAFDGVVGLGYGEVFKSSCLLEFKGHLYSLQSTMLKEALEALESVADTLDAAIVESLGEEAQWTDHAGKDWVHSCGEDEIECGLESLSSDHAQMVSTMWDVREQVNSVLANLC